MGRDRQPGPVPFAIERVCVFCGSSKGSGPAYEAAAVFLGEALAERHITLVYGGGAVGLMGVIADAVLGAGGDVVGVIPAFLQRREIVHTGVTDLRVVESMHDRKALMADLADAFVALPGGIGTFEEMFEAMTWTQLGLQDKPIALLDVAGFWSPVLALLDRAVEDGFLKAEVRESIIHSSVARDVLDRFTTWRRPELGKWIDLEPPVGSETKTEVL